ncbi:hypothetical protein [Terricaulis sp.]|uniref:hypothetical protein n=1 Tax=Terricaulis sp. TaxID=2768686 RepID=UPI002AC79D5B|nr:hypothetical protein [Terricaulis sp.]MDZ4689987.1 hypothetical protein [Terricaulis sp.]
MRFLFIAIACLIATPAAAQDSAQVERAAAALSAIWRPVSGPLTAASIQTACAGAVEEMAAIEAALPPVLDPQSLARVRGLRGFLIVPTGDDPAWSYFFPPLDLAWFRSGIGAIAVLDEAQGLIGVRDASGQDIALQLGRAGEHPVLRVRPPEGGALLTFVGCARSAET